MTCARVLNSTDQRLKSGLINSDVSRFHLNNEPRLIEPETSSTGNNIYAIICSGWRNVHKIALSFKNFSDKSCEIMPDKSGGDTTLNLIPSKKCNVNLLVFKQINSLDRFRPRPSKLVTYALEARVPSSF